MSADALWTFFNQIPVGTKFKMSDDPQPVYEKVSDLQARRRTDPWGLGRGKTMLVLDGHIEVMPVDVRNCYWCAAEFALIDLTFVPRSGDDPGAEPHRFLCGSCEVEQVVDLDKP